MGSQPIHCKGVTIDWVIAMRCERKPQPHGTQSHHPCHQQIKAIINKDEILF